MESAVEPTAGYPPPILKSEFGEEASALEQGQSLAGRAAKEKVPYFSVAVPVQDTSVPVPVFTGMVDAFPIMSVGVDPTDLTLIPLDYESGVTPSLEVVSGPSPDRLSAVSLDYSDASVATAPPTVAIPKRPRLTGPAAADPVPLSTTHWL